MTRPLRPAERLEGMNLDGGWTVLRRIPRPGDSTGGHFSIGYEISNKTTGKRGFLKALDYSSALRESGLRRAERINLLTAAYIHERNLLRRCRERHVDKILYAIEEGQAVVDDSDLGKVDYLIFEMANGDVRKVIAKMKVIDQAWCFRVLHSVAVGIAQLHSIDIVHQDVKPSNVLVLGPSQSKLGDLGRAYCKHETGPHDLKPVAGDPEYAPPELLYKLAAPDFETRRLACDLYHIGGLVIFFTLGVTATARMFLNLPPGMGHRDWTGKYEDVLPYLRAGLAEAVSEIDRSVRGEAGALLSRIASELCDPDPAHRGHPAERRGNHPRYSLRRYVSEFDLLASRAERGMVLRIIR